nr:RNA-directed DNA polymerase, eukaryota [Tanacetum cinerariifolium]
TLFEQAEDGEIRSTAIKDNHKDGPKDAQSDDPFNIYELLNKKHPLEVHQSEGKPKFHSGFTPSNTLEVNSNTKYNSIGDDNKVKEILGMKNDFKASLKEDGDASVCSGHFKSVEIPKTDGSILQRMEDLIKVGQTMGYKMDGCINNIEETVKSQGAQEFYK